MRYSNLMFHNFVFPPVFFFESEEEGEEGVEVTNTASPSHTPLSLASQSVRTFLFIYLSIFLWGGGSGSWKAPVTAAVPD